MTTEERLEYMRGVVIAKMNLHPNDKSFVRFNTDHLMKLLDIAFAANNSAIKTLPLSNALDRLSDS